MKICHDDHKAYLVMIVIIMLITRVIVMMMMIDKAHLVAIVPVKTVDNAPANLLLAFPHRSLPGLEGKIFRFVKFTKVGNKSSLFTKCLNAAAIDPKRNLFCFLSNDLNSHTMK